MTYCMAVCLLFTALHLVQGHRHVLQATSGRDQDTAVVPHGNFCAPVSALLHRHVMRTGLVNIAGISNDLGQSYLNGQQVANTSANSTTRLVTLLAQQNDRDIMVHQDSRSYMLNTAASLCGMAASYNLMVRPTSSLVQIATTSCKRLQITALGHW